MKIDVNFCPCSRIGTERVSNFHKGSFVWYVPGRTRKTDLFIAQERKNVCVWEEGGGVGRGEEGGVVLTYSIKFCDMILM